MPSHRDKLGRFTSNSRRSSPKENNTTDSIAQMLVMEKMLENVQFARTYLSRSLSSSAVDPRRSINHDCGYPETERIAAKDYRDMFDRHPVAARAVEVLPVESWQQQPRVFESEDVEQQTPFELAWDALSDSLLGPSWFKVQEGNIIWHYLRRLDILSGIGSYGVLLFGIGDGQTDLSQPVKFNLDGSASNLKKLLYLRVFDQSTISIKQVETDEGNPRFGQPVLYDLKMNDPRMLEGASQQDKTQTVHWTRVQHVADNTLSSELFGIPRQQQIWDNLLDLKKLYGGSAEMYWRGALPGLAIESHPQLGGDIELTDAQKTTMREQIEQYQNTLQRYLSFVGFTTKSLSPQVVDPSKQIAVQLEAICVKLGIPKRIFMGSERGELASGQDDETWNDRLRERQFHHVIPRIIVPFINRLILLGVLPVPQEQFTVEFPDLSSPSEQDQAAVAVQRTEAMTKYVNGSVDALIAPKDFLVRILQMKEREAEEIIEGAMGQEQRLQPTEDEDEPEEQSAQSNPSGNPKQSSRDTKALES